MMSWFSKLCLKAQNQSVRVQNKNNGFAYRLVDYFYCEKKGGTVLIVQLINKRETKQILPKELLADDSMVRSMSQEDIRLITYLECKQLFAYDYKIESQVLEKDFYQSSVEIRNVETNHIERKKIVDVVGNTDFLKKLRSHDAFNLGCLTGTASVLCEKIPE